MELKFYKLHYKLLMYLIEARSWKAV